MLYGLWYVITNEGMSYYASPPRGRVLRRRMRVVPSQWLESSWALPHI